MFEDLQRIRLETDIKVAVQEIIDAYPQEPIAILLCGGYGRGEGAWYKDADGYPQPYNDYDFAVIADQKLPSDIYGKLRKRIAEKVNIQWIDIAFYKPGYFLRLSPTIKNADLIYASQVVYGDAEFLKKAKVDAAKIGSSDIVKLYKTRIWTFLGSFTGKFHDLNSEETRVFQYQMAKAVLAACDMLLISHKEYTPKYTARVATICRLFPNDTNLCEIAKWALQEKLDPAATPILKDTMEELYWKVKDVYCQAIQMVLPGFFRRLSSIAKTKRYLVFHSDYLLHLFYERLVKHTNITKKSTELFCAQHYIFSANDHGRIDQGLLLRGAQILKTWGYIDELDADWNALRTIVAQARNDI